MIRRAKKEDLSKINELLYQVHDLHARKRPDLFKIGRKKYNDEEILEIISDDNRPIYVYEESKEVLGYGFCVITDYDESSSLATRKELYIDDLCVDKNMRNKGIGKAIYYHILDEAKKMGCYNVTLNVWCLNDSAMKFYESIGLKPLKIYMEKIIEE